MTSHEHLPIAIIGAGPVGLAAACELLEHGLKVRVYESGSEAAANLRSWGHVRLFSPWRYNVSEAAARILAAQGWRAPDPDALPTGRELYERYLNPLSRIPRIAAAIETDAKVVSVSRLGADKSMTSGRDAKPFVVTFVRSDGSRVREAARAVIDASGTWTNPNPMGTDGLPIDGEMDHAERIAYGIPDVLGRDRSLYAGRRTMVVGAGHSAANAIADLARLAEEEPGTSILWTTRSANLARVYGGGAADELPARGALGMGVKTLVESGRVELLAGFAATAMRRTEASVMVEGSMADGLRELGPVDRIIVATGQRPDLSLTRELRLELDPWLESTRALGPLIDPNVHFCGSVPPHGHQELSHPEPGFYTVGVKSYGRAPTFLLLTGYEQVRSVAAAIAGDMAAADDLRLVLPETGVCSTDLESDAGCCGGPAPPGAEACCVADAVVKAKGGDGCGCKAAA